MGNLCSTNKSANHTEKASSTGNVASSPKHSSTAGKEHGLAVMEYNTMILGSDDGKSRPSSMRPVSSSNVSDSSNNYIPLITLLPHQHNLFCERKQRVCTAVGKCQELETLKCINLDSAKYEWIWFRTISSDIFATKEKRKAGLIMPGSENKTEYKLSADDLNLYIGVVYGDIGHLLVVVDETDAIKLVGNTIGPVLAGPPRIVEFHITGTMKVGSYSKGEAKYIGGSEGRSEYWWVRIGKDGKRSQITSPKPIPEKNSTDYDNPKEDSRYYFLTSDDVGCTLKAKCRPIRGDKVEGEIFTSKSSEGVTV